MSLCVPEGTNPTYLSGLPVETIFMPPHGPLPPAVATVDFFVAPEDTQRIREALPHMPSLRVFQVLSAGVDWVLPLVPSGVTFCNGAGIHDVPVSEWVMAAILASCKRFFDYRAIQQKATWGGLAANDWYLAEPAPMDDLEGKTVLLLGYGSIGQAVEARLRPFGVEIVRVAKHERAGVHGAHELSDLLPLADVLVVLAPHTAETDKMLGADLLAKLKPGTLLVNASRGGVIDSRALLQELQDGRLQASLDVTDPEPLPDGHPLWTAPGVFITPHLAGWSPRQLERAYAFIRDQVRRHLGNEPLRNVVAEGY